MGLQDKIAKLGKNLKNVISSIIDPKQMRELAREAGFVKRFNSRLKGDEFMQLLIIESVDGEKNTLRGAVGTLKQIKKNASMSIQGFSQRLNTKEAAALVKSVFQKTLSVVMSQIDVAINISKKALHLLKYFPNVYLQDSSESMLDAELKEEFKGSGGGSGNGKGEASFKVDIIFEYKSKILSWVMVTDRKEPDVVLGEKILEIIKPRDLVIRDLGYSCIGLFQKIQEAGAFFLSRLHPRLNVYLAHDDKEPVSLGVFLEKKVKSSGIVDTMVYIGRQMFQCRMIAYRVPPEIQKSRCKTYLKECKKKRESQIRNI